MNHSEKTKQFRVLWVTNLMAPYRRSLWESVGSQTDLRVVLVEGGDRWIFENDRSDDWVTRPGNFFSASNLPVLTLRTHIGRFHISWDLAKIARDVHNTDVVMVGGWESPAYWQYMLMAKLFRRPTILFHESTNKSATFRQGVIPAIKSFIFRSMDGVVVPGITSHKSVTDLGVSEERIHEGFNSVDMEHFRNPFSDQIARPMHPPRTGHRYIYVGRLIEKKRVDLLIKEFCRVRRTGDHLLIAGKGTLEDQLKQLVQDLGAEHNVSFAGEISYDELPQQLWDSETLVLPSRSKEQWGLVVNEGLAAGLHVVVSRDCGVADSVRGMDGVFVWADDEMQLGEALEASAKAWTGHIPQPEILEYTNERFADTFMRSFCAALQNQK